MLGPDVPPVALGAAARRHQAEVICMSSTMPGRTEKLIRAIDEVREQRPSTGFVVGGRGLTVEHQLRPQVQLCRRVSVVVDAVDATVQHAHHN